MTKQELRDQFAMHALQGLLVHNILKGHDNTKIAYEYADAMLKEREDHEHVLKPSSEFVDIGNSTVKMLYNPCTLCGKEKE